MNTQTQVRATSPRRERAPRKARRVRCQVCGGLTYDAYCDGCTRRDLDAHLAASIARQRAEQAGRERDAEIAARIAAGHEPW